ncbi:MAG: hypothetical protein IKL76_04360 [Clostridia bacterium]|nr:hypothetical protein [Clostridia bacterium]
MNILKKDNIIDNIVKEKLKANGGKALMPTLRGAPIAFWLSATGMGIETDKLSGYILQWEHFREIVKKANSLGGKMYRGDVLAMNGGKLGEDISYDCMEGFIAHELLFIEDGMSVTRRSTYYSGILAWAGIIAIHRSQGQGSFITVNAKYRNI